MSANPEILRQLFKREKISEIPTEALAEMTELYPSFSCLHWLRAAQDKNNKKALQYAALYAYYPGRLLNFVNNATETGQKDIDEEQLPQKPILQPLYTEDYFAYTRTQLPENIKDDKPPTLEQVKSFTGWLRMMKKTHGGPPAEEDKEELSSEAGEKEDSSKDQNPVVTESMAKIWIQHNQKDKAIDIYNKLILLNPEKKSYFAAKISELKEQ